MLRSMLVATTVLVPLIAVVGPRTAAAASETLSFAPVKAPTTDAQKREVLATSKVDVDGRKQSIGYHTLLRSGQKAGEGTFGLIMDEKGKPLVGKDGALMISNATDFSSLLNVDGKLFVVSHFETRPAAMYLTSLERNAQTGELKAVDTKPVDFSAFGGLWVPCAGSVTPWNTHLGSEEYEPDAEAVEAATSLKDIDDYYKPMALYFGFDASAKDATIEGFKKVFNPYAYGWPTEVKVEAGGSAEATKHYAMGRFAHELEYVMPDQKTVYLSDDGTNVGLFMFKADQAGKLDAGQLYAAKWHQTGADNGGSAKLSWVDLGHADSASVRKMVKKGTSFSDIFESAKISANGSCPGGFGAVNTNYGAECLKVKPGMDEAASRLETRRYASLKGATTELRKEEGITFDPGHKRLYVAISEIANGMEDKASKGKPSTEYDLGVSNDIRVAYNECGAVYALDLGRNAKIGSDWVASDMTAMVVGKPTTYPKGSPYAGNTCTIDGIANPDNISYVPGFDTLFIGEDTETGHQNDAVWAYDLRDQKLTRVETTPYGSETTSVYTYPNVEGHGYVMSVVQHPYGESDEDKLQNPAQSMAYLGYLGPLPKLD